MLLRTDIFPVAALFGAFFSVSFFCRLRLYKREKEIKPKFSFFLLPISSFRSAVSSYFGFYILQSMSELSYFRNDSVKKKEKDPECRDNNDFCCCSIKKFHKTHTFLCRRYLYGQNFIRSNKGGGLLSDPKRDRIKFLLRRR